MNTVHGHVAVAAVDEAVRWYLSNRSGELSAAERQGFAAWLRASPMNVREYLAITALSRDLPEAAEVSAGELETLTRQARAGNPANVVPISSSSSPLPLQGERVEGRRHLSRFHHRPALAATLAILALTALGYWTFAPPVYRTALGEQRTIRLDDGSLLHLNSGSAVSIRYSAAERRIDMARGQLMIEVAADPARPLRVHAGDARILAVGTKFDVYRRTADVLVTVVQGRVRVEGEGLSAPVPLSPGEQLRIDPAGPAPVAVNVDLTAVTAWLQGNIKFLRAPLAEVAAEFNRYHPVPVHVEGALRELRVSGVFSAYDSDSFVEFVRRIESVEVSRTPRAIRVYRRE